MPNHVTNNVTFTGSEERVNELLSFVKGEDREFDFNKIAPIPKELEGTQSPLRIISQEEYDKQEERIAKGELTDNEKNWGLSRGLTQELADEYRTRFGASDWYDWQCDNWGTKWNAYEVTHFDNVIEFQTAWSTPYPIFVKLSKLFPDVLISVRYSDEDFGYNVGEFDLRNGEEVKVNQPKGGSVEAYELAMDIQYGTPEDYFHCNQEIFTDEYTEEDDDELSDYVSRMVDIAYANKYYPYEDCEFHNLVLERFKELALADEKFELVIIIQKELDKVEK